MNLYDSFRIHFLALPTLAGFRLTDGSEHGLFRYIGSLSVFLSICESKFSRPIRQNPLSLPFVKYER